MLATPTRGLPGNTCSSKHTSWYFNGFVCWLDVLTHLTAPLYDVREVGYSPPPQGYSLPPPPAYSLCTLLALTFEMKRLAISVPCASFVVIHTVPFSMPYRMRCVHVWCVCVCVCVHVVCVCVCVCVRTQYEREGWECAEVHHHRPPRDVPHVQG